MGEQQRAQLAIGSLLMFGNSVVVMCLGALMYPVLSGCSHAIACSYLGARCSESILLSVGICCAWATSSVEDGDVFKALLSIKFATYQLAMLSLCFGSIPTWIVALHHDLLPAWLALIGIIGYSVLLVGSVGEVLG